MFLFSNSTFEYTKLKAKLSELHLFYILVQENKFQTRNAIKMTQILLFLQYFLFF